MGWNCYRVTLEAKSPIHVGYGAKLGTVAKTRYYILAKHVWAALTNVLAQKHGENYKTVGDALKAHACFSYFYIKHNDKLYAPKYVGSEGLKIGDLRVEEFEQRFISSFGSTSMEKKQKSAEDGSLHEIEFIKTITLSKPVLFEGYLFFDNKQIQIGSKNLDVEQLTGLDIQVGGERTYGFGKVKIKEMIEAKELFEHFSLELDHEPVLKPKNPFYAYAHVLTEKTTDLVKNVSGDLEPLVGRDWCREKGAGRYITPAQICYVPGTQITLNQPTGLKITKDGLWVFAPINQTAT
ncbi:MAG: hypothetical protein N3D85_07605 [Candidatus Bathyarchaeota archaeon]|nr:hypothetical protein [Candidatus Bathyarchaeota archaeon]